MKSLASILISATAAGILFVGCSSSPSASEAKVIVEKEIQIQSKGLIRLVDFEKTDGQKSELMGVTTYTMEFRAKIEFNSDCYWGSPFGGFETVTSHPGPLNAYKFMGKRRATAGEVTTISGALQLSQTEKGWRGQLVSTKVELQKPPDTPYDESEAAVKLREELQRQLDRGQLTQEQTDEIVDQINEISDKVDRGQLTAKEADRIIDQMRKNIQDSPK